MGDLGAHRAQLLCGRAYSKRLYHGQDMEHPRGYAASGARKCEVNHAEESGGGAARRKKDRVKGGIYHKIQIEFTYNSNHIEGSRLTHDQTRYIYETNTIAAETGAVNVDDIVETANHFRCIDLAIEQANYALSEVFIKTLHRTLKTGTRDARIGRFPAGAYKTLPNEVGGRRTAAPEEVPERIRALLRRYRIVKKKTFEDLIAFHYEFEAIHPFQDGNGRVGRLILLKECLRHGIVPFIIDEDLKMFYYRGLREWTSERGYLIDTCLSAQDKFKAYMDYFRVPYGK
ncbi:Fic family protein [Selenomonas sp. oral taxon 137 str. F0430]|nr:Fic family protein [Selenomonas sp. oral taxon 137 str. F0430]